MSRTVSAEGRSRAYVGGRSVPVVAARRPGRRPGRRARPGRPAAAAAAGPAAPGARPVRRAGAGTPSLADYQRRLPAAPRGPGRARRADQARPGSAPRRPRTCAAAWPRSSGRARGRARTSSCWPRRSGWRTPTRCTPPRPRRTRRCSATRPAGPTRRADAVSLLGRGPAGAGGRGRARPGAGRAGRPAGRGRLPGLRRRRRAGLLRASRSTPTRPGSPRCRSGAPR